MKMIFRICFFTYFLSTPSAEGEAVRIEKYYLRALKNLNFTGESVRGMIQRWKVTAIKADEEFTQLRDMFRSSCSSSSIWNFSLMDFMCCDDFWCFSPFSFRAFFILFIFFRVRNYKEKAQKSVWDKISDSYLRIVYIVWIVATIWRYFLPLFPLYLSLLLTPLHSVITLFQLLLFSCLWFFHSQNTSNDTHCVTLCNLFYLHWSNYVALRYFLW